jgi:hypothetical protein
MRPTVQFQSHFALSHVVAMRLNLSSASPLSDVYSEAETHRLRCGRVVPRVSVDPNCGIRVDLKLGTTPISEQLDL